MTTSRTTRLLRQACACLGALHLSLALASDHLDTPTVTADPAADIGDLYAWTSADGRRLNLVLDIVGKRFSDQVRYVIHVDSGRGVGSTSARTAIVCRFDVDAAAHCWAGDRDRATGDASTPRGLAGRNGRFRVFAGPRDDPYFNNVRGTRTALDAAADAMRRGAAPRDATGFPRFDAATLDTLHQRWRETQGGPAKNFLAGWTTDAIVVSVDLDVVNAGGPLLAIWARTERLEHDPARPANDDAGPPPPGAPIDRAGRPLTANALVGTFSEHDISDQLKEAYNRVDEPGWAAFATEMGRNLAIYDGLDGVAGNQWLVDRSKDTPDRYQRLARLLADDRLWVDSRRTKCERFLAVEQAAFGDASASSDCGGRTPSENVNGVFRSMLIRGTPDGVDDGVDHDDRIHSSTDFPFLAAP
jgi:hypothetical protein